MSMGRPRFDPRQPQRQFQIRVNHRIRVPEVRVIDANGEMLGVLSTHEALKRELTETRATLAERRIIERAKGHLMRARRIDEAEAHAALRRMAMDRGVRLVVAARDVLPKEKAFPPEK